MQRIGIIGGSGALGFGLGLRWAVAGQPVVIGSRSPDTARTAASEMSSLAAAAGSSDIAIEGMSNLEAATVAEIVVLAVPFAQQQAAIDAVGTALDGKILVDTTVPLVPPRVGTVQLPPEGSSALSLRSKLGDGVRIVSAFQNVAASKLKSLEELDCDVLVTGDDREACAAVVDLAAMAGMRGFYAGPLANAVAAEALTSVLITINRQFKCHAGVRVAGL